MKERTIRFTDEEVREIVEDTGLMGDMKERGYTLEECVEALMDLMYGNMNEHFGTETRWFCRDGQEFIEQLIDEQRKVKPVYTMKLRKKTKFGDE